MSVLIQRVSQYSQSRFIHAPKMKARDLRGSNIRDTFYTLAPLNCILRFFGLNCIYRDNAKLKCDWSWPKAVFLIHLLFFLTVLTVYNKIFIWKNITSFSFRDVFQVVYLCGFFQYLVDLCFVYKYGRNDCLNYLSVYEKIDGILGITSYSGIRKCIIKVLIIVAAISIISCVIDFYAWFVNFGVQIVFTNFIEYFYAVLRDLSFADAIAHVTQVSYRLKIMGDVVKEFYLVNDTVLGLKDVSTDKKTVREEWKKGPTLYLRPVTSIEQYQLVLAKFSGCYLLIVEQCDYINAMYGVRILGVCFSVFIDMVALLNVIARITGGALTNGIKFSALPAVASLVRLFACVSLLFHAVYKCEQTYSRTKRIIRYIDRLLINKEISRDTVQALNEFRSLLISRQVEFSAVNFYKLDYSLLLSMASVVVTYTILLLQNLN